VNLSSKFEVGHIQGELSHRKRSAPAVCPSYGPWLAKRFRYVGSDGVAEWLPRRGRSRADTSVESRNAST
jgi:hypothetical protein